MSEQVDLHKVTTVDQVRENCRRFAQGTGANPDRARKISTATLYWVYDAEAGTFGPGKFVGFADMTFPKYEAANSKRAVSGAFHGHIARSAVSGVLEEFSQATLLTQRLIEFLTPDVCDSIDTSKWRFVTLPRIRNYFALACNPSRYDGLGAVAALPELTWTVNRMEPQVGDRILLWQTKGRTGRRGVIALGEVTRGIREEPELTRDSTFWVDPTDAGGVEPRIRLKVFDTAGLPMWEHPNNPWLANLAVARARGGTVFELEPEEWRRIANCTDAPTIAIDREGSSGALGQGIGLSAPERRAVELHAQGMVEEYYVSLGYTVADVSSTKPFDLCCSRDGDVLHVEVKGTTGLGREVIVTKNEVAHARKQLPMTALAIVSEIRLNRVGDTPTTRGGSMNIWQPWDVDAGSLTPTQFRHSPPEC